MTGGWCTLSRNAEFRGSDPGGAGTFEGSVAFGGMVRRQELPLEFSYGQMNANWRFETSVWGWSSSASFPWPVRVDGRGIRDSQTAGTLQASADGSRDYRLLQRLEPLAVSCRAGPWLFRSSGLRCVFGGVLVGVGGVAAAVGAGAAQEGYEPLGAAVFGGPSGPPASSRRSSGRGCSSR